MTSQDQGRGRGPDADEQGDGDSEPDVEHPDLRGRRLAIIGSRGYPSTYSGFETLVRRLAPYLVACGAEVTVYGRGAGRKETEVDGITVVDTFGVDRKTTSTLTFGATSAWDASRRGFDAALVLNVANGFWLPLLRRAGISTAVNVDGIEWERGKWSGVGRKMFWYGARLTARWADLIICDSDAIVRAWHDLFGVDGVFIPYGGDLVTDAGADRIASLGLEPGRYVLVVARVVPENNFDMFLDAVDGIEGDARVVVVGSAKGASPLEARLQGAHDAGRILWLGHVKDQELLVQLWANSGAYFHGHSVGGTNPSLLQALGCGARVVAFDSVYNREVLGDDSYLVSSATQLSDVLRSFLDDRSGRAAAAERAREIVADRYRWQSVCHAYATALEGLARSTNSSARLPAGPDGSSDARARAT